MRNSGSNRHYALFRFPKLTEFAIGVNAKMANFPILAFLHISIPRGELYA